LLYQFTKEGVPGVLVLLQGLEAHLHQIIVVLGVLEEKRMSSQYFKISNFKE